MLSRKTEIKLMSLKELVHNLSTFEGNRNDSFFVTLALNPDKKIIKVDIVSSELNQLIHSAASVNSKTKHRVKPVLVKRPRLKRSSLLICSLVNVFTTFLGALSG